MECAGPAPSPEGVRWLPSAVSPAKKLEKINFWSNIAPMKNLMLAERFFEELSRNSEIKQENHYGQQANKIGTLLQ